MIDRVLVAYHMFEQEGLGARLPPGELGKIVHSQIDAHPVRKERLLYIASLCEGKYTPLARYTRAYALLWAGASARPDAIEAMREYINSGIVAKELPNHEKVDQLRAWDYLSLAEALEGEYQFEEAYDAYTKALSLHPALSPAAINRSLLLVKMGRMDDAIDQLIAYHDSGVCPKELESSVVAYIKEIREKKRKGYVYRPRKKNR